MSDRGAVSSEVNPFSSLCQRLVRGTPEERIAAVGEISVRYGEHLERFARQRMGRRLRTLKGSSGIVNSVCANLLCRDLSKWNFGSEGELLALLGETVLNKIIDGERELGAKKRGMEKNATSLDAADPGSPSRDVADRSAPTPSFQVRKEEQAELVQNFLTSMQRVLTADEFELLMKFHIEKHSLAELAAERTASQDAVRMQLQRIRKKIKEQLGLPEDLLTDD